MAQFPWKKGKSSPTYDDLIAEMNNRFGSKFKSPMATGGNVQGTDPLTKPKPKRKMRVVGKTGYPE
jgi:hypothetical protein